MATPAGDGRLASSRDASGRAASLLLAGSDLKEEGGGLKPRRPDSGRPTRARAGPSARVKKQEDSDKAI